MSEYQRYEFMTVDQPLTQKQRSAVDKLSSHIESSSTHAVIEYNWGDFKHDPVDVLYRFFDGFLYWANWGNPAFALRFPHGTLPANLIIDNELNDLDDFITFTQHSDYDILDIHFNEMEAPEEWTDYDLGSLIAIRSELMNGDLRALYIVWLAASQYIIGYDEDEDDEDEENGDEDENDENVSVPAVPADFKKLTAAQLALVELLQVPSVLLTAAMQHSTTATASPEDDFAAWVKLMPQERRDDYLVRLAHNEPGLHRLLSAELRKLNPHKTQETSSTGEHVTYTTLLAESKTIQAELERKQAEQEQQARRLQIQYIHDNQDDYWHQIDQAVTRGSGPGYDEATRLLLELRKVANTFKEQATFQARLLTWVQPHLRRKAFIQRLQEHKLTLEDE